MSAPGATRYAACSPRQVHTHVTIRVIVALLFVMALPSPLIVNSRSGCFRAEERRNRNPAEIEPTALSYASGHEPATPPYASQREISTVLTAGSRTSADGRKRVHRPPIVVQFSNIDAVDAVPVDRGALVRSVR